MRNSHIVFKNSYDCGLSTEELFKRCLAKLNIFSNIRIASQHDNHNLHIDIWATLNKSNKDKSFSIKSMKRIKRHKNLQDEYFIVELANNAHKINPDGWLFGGAADFIASMRQSYFLVMLMSDLQKFIRSYIQPDFKKRAIKYNNPSPYIVYYRRENIKRRDYLMLVPYSDIEKYLKCIKLKF